MRQTTDSCSCPTGRVILYVFNMNILRRHSLLSLVLSVGVVSLASAGAMPSMQVKVAKAAGKVVYEGSTDSAGAFHTAPLAPGNYTVQFKAKSAPKGGPFSIILDDTGKGGSVSSSVPGGKFTGGGVALNAEVGPKAMSLSGHVAPAGSAKARTAPLESHRQSLRLLAR